GAGEDVAAGVSRAGEGGWAKRGEGRIEGDDAVAADEVVDVGLLEPAFGFGGFEFEFGDGFDGVAGDGDFGVVRGEFVSGVFGAGEGAVALLIEGGTDGADGVGEEGVVGDVEIVDGEAGFYGGELGEHGGWEGWELWEGWEGC